MTNITARSYCPRIGSIPAKAIQYFANHLSARHTEAELAALLGVATDSFAKCLGDALQAGFLSRSNGYYTAGDDIDEAPDYGSASQADATIAQARTTQLNAFGAPIKAQASPLVAKPALQAKQSLPDPASLLIEDDVPLPTGRGSGTVNWKATLLDRIKVGQSVALPINLKSTLAKFTAQEHKTSEKIFVTRITSSVQFRIWRTA
jgi:hypothetical protein